MTNRKRNILLLIGAFTFAFFIGTTIHEFGHVIALRLFGVNQYKIFIHPFLGNQVNWNVNNDYIGYVDAAGPLFNILIGNALLVAFWRQREIVIPSILLLGPVALIQEGSNTLIQIALNIPGTDAIRIINAGVPASVLAVIATILLILGVLILTIELPLYGISPSDGYIDRLSTTLPGFVAYMAAIYLYSLVFNPIGAVRGLVLIILSSIIAILVSYVYMPIIKRVGLWLHCDLIQSDWKVVSKVLGLAVVTLIFGLMLFN